MNVDLNQWSPITLTAFTRIYMAWENRDTNKVRVVYCKEGEKMGAVFFCVSEALSYLHSDEFQELIKKEEDDE